MATHSCLSDLYSPSRDPGTKLQSSCRTCPSLLSLLTLSPSSVSCDTGNGSQESGQRGNLCLVGQAMLHSSPLLSPISHSTYNVNSISFQK